MKILVVGSSGFLGRNVVEGLRRDHDVYSGVRTIRSDQDRQVKIDLGNKGSVRAALVEVRPEIVVNCAGIVDPTGDFSQNILFTRNILESIVEESIGVKKIIISGSAGEYGLVDVADLPVAENAPLAAISEYGKSKVQEVEFAREFAKQHALTVTEARVFNPIGPGMHDKFLITRILKQLDEINSGSRQELEVNRLDAARDYIDIRDVASAIQALTISPTRYSEYNIGSGKATTNQELINLLFEHISLNNKVRIKELSTTPEPSVASEADITRITSDIGWKPSITMVETIRDIMEEAEDDKQ
jgi:GDP-4-dehydro-6-deoxy-D-mannose reductase